RDFHVTGVQTCALPVITNSPTPPEVRVLPELDEPWRVRPRRRHRRPRDRRRWAAPVVSAGLAALGTVAVFYFAGAPGASPSSRLPRTDATPLDYRLSPSLTGQAATPGGGRSPSRTRRGHDRPSSEANVAPAEAVPGNRRVQPPRPRSSTVTPKERARRPRTVKPPQARRVPGWVRAECRRRFP